MFNVFDWMFNMTEKSTERVRRWIMNNPERRKEIDRKASKAYYHRMKDDPEFMEKKREQNREGAARNYAKKRAEMTPEELEEYRRKTRERVARIRAEKKARAAAAAESKPEE